MRFLFWTLRLGLISSAGTLAAMAIVALWVYFHPIHKITTHLWGTCPSEIDGDYTIIDIDGEKLRLPTELIESCYAPYARRTIFDNPRTVTLSGNLSDFAKFTGQNDPLPVNPPIKVLISGKIPGVRYQDKTVEELNSINTTDLLEHIEFVHEGAITQYQKSDRKLSGLTKYTRNHQNYFENYDFLLPTDKLIYVEYFIICQYQKNKSYDICKSNRYFISKYLHFEISLGPKHIAEFQSISKVTKNLFFLPKNHLSH